MHEFGHRAISGIAVVVVTDFAALLYISKETMYP